MPSTTFAGGKPPIRLGIFAHFDSTWTGGEHYLRNLLSAIAERDELEIILYAQPAFETDDYAATRIQVRRPPALVRWSPAWFTSKIAERTDRRRLDPIERLVQRDRIDVTYLRPVHVSSSRVPNAHWVPDLQYRHLPALYTRRQLLKSERVDKRAVRRSARVVVSSAEGQRHLASFMPEAAGKTDILNFAVELPASVFTCDPLAVCRKHGLPGRFILFPSQFWKHKNHGLVLDALAMLEDGPERPVIICTGEPSDFRGHAHLDELLARRAALGLTKAMRVLGLLPRAELYALMRRAIALLNPSLFEGWSTPVEEGKALGIPLVLSDIPVHHEQTGEKAHFFDPRSPDGLARTLLDVWRQGRAGPCIEREAAAKRQAGRDKKMFGETFAGIITNMADMRLRCHKIDVARARKKYFKLNV